MGSLFDAVTRGRVWIAVMVLVEEDWRLETRRGTGEAERQPEREFDLQDEGRIMFDTIMSLHGQLLHNCAVHSWQSYAGYYLRVVIAVVAHVV